MKRVHLFTTLLLLPVAFLTLAYTFRGEVALDRAKMLEELAKGLLVTFTVYFSHVIGISEVRRQQLESTRAVHAMLMRRLDQQRPAIASIVDCSPLLFGEIPPQQMLANERARDKLKATLTAACTDCRTIIDWLKYQNPLLLVESGAVINAMHAFCLKGEAYLSRPSSAALRDVQVAANSLLSAIYQPII